jgi:TELO2-interacting protein 1
VHDGVEDDPVLRHQIAGVLFVILPKTLAALCAVIQGDDKQGQALMTGALKAFGRVVCLVMQDFSEPTPEPEISASDFRAAFDAGSSANPKDREILGMNVKDEKRREFFNSVERTDEWLQAAARKLAPTIKSLSMIRGSPYEAMRKELAVASALLVEGCPKNLRHSLPDLLENLIALSQDADQATAGVANRALRQFIDGQRYLDVWSQLETLFYNCLLALPRIMHRCEERRQLAGLALLRGYLTFLSEEHLAVIVGQPHILEYLVKALLACAELDLPANLLDCEYSVPGLDGAGQKPGWKQYKLLKTDAAVAEFRTVCQAIGQSVAFDRIIGYILDNWLESAGRCNEFVALLAEISLAISEGADQRRCVAAILDELADDVHWDLEIRPNRRVGIEQDEFGESTWFEDRIEGVYESATEIRIADVHYNDADELAADVVTILDAKFNVLHECLALEMVGNGALALGAGFERFLFKFLHRILEKMGNRNVHLHNAGHYALAAVAQGLACGSTAELVHQNANFFIYFINKSMKQHQYNSSGLDILAIVLQHSRLDSIPYLESMIRSVLEELALHQRHNVAASLNIFNVFIANLGQWQAAEAVAMDEPTPGATASTLERWLGVLARDNEVPNAAFVEAADLGKTAQEMYDEDLEKKAGEEDEEAMGEEIVEKKPPPRHVELARDIVACCLKYMPSTTVDEQAMAVETVNHGLRCLRDYENELLPMVHQVWYPLAERFKEKNPIVVSRCFDLLLTMGQCAKDFILQRTLK